MLDLVNTYAIMKLSIIDGLGGVCCMNIAILDPISEDVNIELSLINKFDHNLIIPKSTLLGDDWVNEVYGCSAIITEKVKITDKVMDKLPNCGAYVRMGIGVDNIDIKAATERGVCIFNVPNYCVEEVANHTLALLLCAMRSIDVYSRRAKRGRWTFKITRRIPRASTQTVGVFGVGNVGRALIKRLLPLKCDIIACESYPENSIHLLENNDIKLVDKDTLFSNADYIILLVPLAESTRYLINKDSIKRMKKNAWIINTSRGGLINERDLDAALEKGLIAGVALDVMESEPPKHNNKLLNRENVIITPHISFYSEDSLRDLRTLSVQICIDYLRGNIPKSLVNKEVLKY